MREALIGLALALAVAAVFAPVRNYGFADFDDPGYVVDNAEVRQGLTWSGVTWAFTTTRLANWHPLTWLSYMADVALFGPDPGKHHLVNVALHALNTLLLFGWLARVTRSLAPSAFVAALFAVHPLHVEPVAWIAQRKELLCTFFWLLSLWGYAFYVERPRLRRLLLVLACFALALLAKPMAVTLPFALLLLDVWPLGRAQRSSWLALVREKLPLLALSLAASALAFVAQQRGGAMVELVDAPLSLRLSNAAVSYAAYLAKAIWPTRLAVLYPYPESLPGWQIAGAVVLLIGISALALRAARTRPYLLVGWLWFLGTLVPVIGLVQIGNQAYADRYVYVPLIGLFVALAWGARDLAAGWTHGARLLGTGALIAIAACAVVTRAQLRHWRDPVALWTHALAVTSDNPLAHNNLGVAVGRLGRSDEATAHFREALRIHPYYADAHFNLGNHLFDEKQFAEAQRHYSDAIRSEPEWAKPRLGLAVCLVAAGRLDDAIREMTSAVELEPGDANFRFNLAVMLLGQGKHAAAARHLEAALALDPGHSGARRELDALRSDRARP